MELIVAVYDDWGIGRDGTQPLALRADRRFFREMTKGKTVLVGRRTAADFPGGKPLPGRRNIILSRQSPDMPGFELCHDPDHAPAEAMVIGGGSVYVQLLPRCDRAYITKVHACPVSDTFFPNLDESADWQLEQILCSGCEDGIEYEMCLYIRRGEGGPHA